MSANDYPEVSVAVIRYGDVEWYWVQRVECFVIDSHAAAPVVSCLWPLVSELWATLRAFQSRRRPKAAWTSGDITRRDVQIEVNRRSDDPLTAISSLSGGILRCPIPDDVPFWCMETIPVRLGA